MAIGVTVIAIMLGWKFLPKPVQAVPGALAAVVTATAMSYLWFPSVERIQLDARKIDAIAVCRRCRPAAGRPSPPPC